VVVAIIAYCYNSDARLMVCGRAPSPFGDHWMEAGRLENAADSGEEFVVEEFGIYDKGNDRW